MTTREPTTHAFSHWTGICVDQYSALRGLRTTREWGLSRIILIHSWPYSDRFLRAKAAYCFQSALAIAILSVCPSVTRVDQSKTV